MQTNSYMLPMRRKLRPFRLIDSLDGCLRTAKQVFKQKFNRG
jgi:hypothetical protein